MSFSCRAFAALAASTGLVLAPASASAIVGGTAAPTGKYPATPGDGTDRHRGASSSAPGP